MNRDRVIYATALIAVFAACFAVYQFYFKAKLEKYAQDRQLLENLQSTYANLNSTFKDEDPDAVISQYKSVVESWKDAIEVRVPYFSDAAWREHENPPEDVFILQFWYGEQTREMTNELWETARAKYGAQVYQRFPTDVQGMLGVAYAEQWQGYDITKELVTEHLERLSYGISVLNMLMEHDAEVIRQVSIYEPKQSGFIGPEVEYSRVGLSFTMEIENFVDFIEEMRASDRYFSIEGMKIAHAFIAARYEPQLEIEMFLLRAKPKESFLTGAATLTAGGTPATGLGAAQPGNVQGAFQRFTSADDDDSVTPVEEPSGFAKAWRWFKRTVLFTN